MGRDTKSGPIPSSTEGAQRELRDNSLQQMELSNIFHKIKSKQTPNPSTSSKVVYLLLSDFISWAIVTAWNTTTATRKTSAVAMFWSLVNRMDKKKSSNNNNINIIVTSTITTTRKSRW